MGALGVWGIPGRILSGNSLADQHVWMWLKTLPLPVECYQSVRALAVNY